MLQHLGLPKHGEVWSHQCGICRLAKEVVFQVLSDCLHLPLFHAFLNLS